MQVRTLRTIVAGRPAITTARTSQRPHAVSLDTPQWRILPASIIAAMPSTCSRIEGPPAFSIDGSNSVEPNIGTLRWGQWI